MESSSPTPSSSAMHPPYTLHQRHHLHNNQNVYSTLHPHHLLRRHRRHPPSSNPIVSSTIYCLKPPTFPIPLRLPLHNHPIHRPHLPIQQPLLTSLRRPPPVKHSRELVSPVGMATALWISVRGVEYQERVGKGVASGFATAVELRRGVAGRSMDFGWQGC